MTDDKTNSLKMIITCTSKIIFNYLTDFSYFPLKNKFWMLQDMVTQNGSKIEVLKGGVVMVCVIKSPKQHLGDLLFLLRFLLLLLFSSSSFFLSFFLSFIPWHMNLSTADLRNYWTEFHETWWSYRYMFLVGPKVLW